MNWLGKAFGTVFGFLLAGPVGAAVGAAFGHKLDHKDGQTLRKLDNQISTSAHSAFFNATFAVMGHLAKSDGRVSEAEIRMAGEIMNRMQLTSDQRRIAVQRYGDGKQSGFALDATLDAFRKECRTRYTLLRLFLEIQVECAYCEGEPGTVQEQLLLHICRRIKFSQFEFHAMKLRKQAEVRLQNEQQTQTRRQQSSWQAPPPPPPRRRVVNVMEEAYALLGVSSRASDDEVKRAYRRLMSQNHPDKLAARGVSEAIIRRANDKTQQIRKAYDRIAKSRKF